MPRKLVILIFSVLTSCVFAGNGTQQIGIGSASQAMGGTGITYNETASDSLFKNPASLGFLTSETTPFKLDTQVTFIKLNSTSDLGSGTRNNKSSGRLAPSVAGAYRLCEHLTLGLGILGYGGGTLDYSGESVVNEIKAVLTYLRLAPSISYQVDHFYFGFSPLIEYGEFSFSENALSQGANQNPPHGDTALSFKAGANLNLDNGLRFGLTYLHRRNFEFRDIFDRDRFGSAVANTATYGLDSLTLGQPSELGMGVSFTGLDNWVFAFDYRLIFWSDAKGYDAFGWNNQSVLALGAKYQINALALRLGFNYSPSQISSETGQSGLTEIDVQGKSVYTANVSQLNATGFTAISEFHITFGAGYEFSNKLGADLSFYYSPKATLTRSGTGSSIITPNTDYTYTGTLASWGLGTNIHFNF